MKGGVGRSVRKGDITMEVEVRVMQLLALNMEGGFKPRSTKELASRRWKRQGNIRP